MATEENKSEQTSNSDDSSVQKIRVKVVDTAEKVSEKVSGTVSEGAVKAKKLANASSAVLQTNFNKAKRTGLLAIKKVAELLTPRDKQQK